MSKWLGIRLVTRPSLLIRDRYESWPWSDSVAADFVFAQSGPQAVKEFQEWAEGAKGWMDLALLEILRVSTFRVW